MTTCIRSERLDLITLSQGFLKAAVEEDLAGAERILGLPLPHGLLDLRDVAALRLGQLSADPALEPWLLRGMVLREPRAMIGHIGFHTAPGADYLLPLAPGAVEFGFTVYPEYRRKGYAREASLALMRWAHQAHGTARFVLSISPDNTASQGLAASLGFVRIGSHIDEEDGLEDVLERSFPKGAMP